MKRRFHIRTLLLLFGVLILPSAPVHARMISLPSFQEGTPTPEIAPPSPADIINAVNNLRLFNGLNPLAIHPVLMEVAAEQANALAGTEGAIGHQRPCGISLGQYLLMKGFPLWGDLSLDGYRSENWVAAGTVEDVMAFWSSDAEHLNTILSPNRSHLGAAVAVSDQIYVVLETALQTRTGQNQSTAYDILTNIPATQAACQGGSTINPDGSVSQYSIPIAVSTARPDGDVVHEVKYGQTLWSIAIEYGTTIEQIKRYNNLTTDAIAPGWKLLIQKGATQPAPPTPTHFVSEATPMPTVPSTPTAMTSPIESPPSANDTDVFAELGQNRTVVAALIISLSVLVAGMIGFGRKKPE